MKNAKATGPDGIPAEVWKNSALAHDELFFFLKNIWAHECVPKSLVLCAFVMIHKKDSTEDCANYRAIGLLNHSYKILSICLLNRLIDETDWFLSDWQAGFRGKRGCRDNLLLLRVIYDQIIKGNKKCVVTFIDFAAAFDSVSHKFLDKALGVAGAKRKTRALFREIYAAAQVAVRLASTDGKIRLSRTFNVARGVIQGDIISPIFFILALDQLIQTYDKDGQGVAVGHINSIRVLGYADDVAMTETEVADMTTRITEFADTAMEHADMKMKMSKTCTQILKKSGKTSAATVAEIQAKMKKYKYKCEYAGAGCSQRFKTKRGMTIHCSSCNFAYATTETKDEVEEIISVFGKAERKLFLVRWKGFPGQDSWEKEHSLLQDGCAPSIKDFWNRSGLNPALDYYPDPDPEPDGGQYRCWMCGWKSTKTNKKRGLCMHIRKCDHAWEKARAHLSERKDIRQDKLAARHEKMPHVYWGDKRVQNEWQALYLGSLFQADGDQIPDVRARCGMAKTRAGTLRHVWSANLPLDLKLRIYISTCCSILVYGSEAWLLSKEACKIINGANAYMLSHITGKTKREEATRATCTFNILAWIRSRRLRWAGHILRLEDDRLLKQALKVIYDHPQEGDMLMDVERLTWEELVKKAADRDAWRTEVNRLKQQAQRTTKPQKSSSSQRVKPSSKRSRFVFYPTKAQREEAAADLSEDNPFRNAKKQCTIKRGNAIYSFEPPPPKRPRTKQRKKKKKRSMTNSRAREAFYDKMMAGAREETDRVNFFEPTAKNNNNKTITTKKKTNLNANLNLNQPKKQELKKQQAHRHANAVPSWDDAKEAVFSSSDSDTSSLSPSFEYRDTDIVTSGLAKKDETPSPTNGTTGTEDSPSSPPQRTSIDLSDVFRSAMALIAKEEQSTPTKAPSLWAVPAPPSLPITPSHAKSYLTRETRDENGELWAAAAPLPSPSPTAQPARDENYDYNQRDENGELWAMPAPMPTPSPTAQPSRDENDEIWATPAPQPTPIPIDNTSYHHKSLHTPTKNTNLSKLIIYYPVPSPLPPSDCNPAELNKFECDISPLKLTNDPFECNPNPFDCNPNPFDEPPSFEYESNLDTDIPNNEPNPFECDLSPIL